jgi:transcriptional regulator with XRE-family HTH domain
MEACQHVLLSQPRSRPAGRSGARGVGARIRELRLGQNLSQENLDLESGLSIHTIIGIEWGRKSVAYERLWDIAEVLDVPVEQLLVDADSEAKPASIVEAGVQWVIVKPKPNVSSAVREVQGKARTQ